MEEEVYQYLRNYGFTKEEVNDFEKHNIKLYEVEFLSVQYNFHFLEKYGLSKEEILDLIRNNIYMITVNKRKLDYLEKIYKEVLIFNDDDIKELLFKYNDLYIVNPIKVEELIKFYRNKNYSIEDIKKLIIINPGILGIDLA